MERAVSHGEAARQPRAAGRRGRLACGPDRERLQAAGVNALCGGARGCPGPGTAGAQLKAVSDTALVLLVDAEPPGGL